MFEYKFKVRLTGGSVQNFSNKDGSECKIGDIIDFKYRAKSYGNALSRLKDTMRFCHCKFEIIEVI